MKKEKFAKVIPYIPLLPIYGLIVNYMTYRKERAMFISVINVSKKFAIMLCKLGFMVNKYTLFKMTSYVYFEDLDTDHTDIDQVRQAAHDAVTNEVLRNISESQLIGVMVIDQTVKSDHVLISMEPLTRRFVILYAKIVLIQLAVLAVLAFTAFQIFN